MTLLALLTLPLLLILLQSCLAFSPILPKLTIERRRRTATSSSLQALSERQIQFWQNVEEGLNDIEAYYKTKGQSMDRVRQFGKSARGEIPPPQGSKSEMHEPCEEYIEGLTARPFWNLTKDLFPWASKLEEYASVIQQEFEEASQNLCFASDSKWQSQVMGQGWSAIRLQRLGVWNVENCNKFPMTYKILQSLDIPFAVRGVCFARQAPQSGVEPHSDGRNFILTSHLGLSIPDGCWIKSGTETRNWEQGKLTTLDTSFVHSTGNPTNQDRVVLIVDYWHPELTQAERAGLEFIYDLRNQFESGTVPFQKPKQGLAGFWNSLMTGGN